MSGIELIAAERARQVSEEGYDAWHDDKHLQGSLALAGALYAAASVGTQLYARLISGTCVSSWDPWPWAKEYDKRPGDLSAMTVKERLRLLTQAGALIAAEIDRLERAGQSKTPEAEAPGA